jgi:hypothetical protein
MVPGEVMVAMVEELKVAVRVEPLEEREVEVGSEVEKEVGEEGRQLQLVEEAGPPGKEGEADEQYLVLVAESDVVRYSD